MCKKLCVCDWIGMILLVVGGLNWGLVGIFDFDLVAYIFTAGSLLARIVYVLVAVSALYTLVVLPKFKKHCKECGVGGQNTI